MILYQIFSVLSLIISVYSWALIIYIFMSWVPNARESSIGRFLANICEPYLEPFRKIIPPIAMLDISPIVAIIVLRFATGGLWGLYRMIAMYT
ncbi:YggT family protein [Bacillus atrophaeus]|uniref:YggT family protein n=1 Tax=Bacillus atrophaeus TaxID=1452 RepID=UPI00227F9738|nr:YggT family protein [Bacillus atrophaeus]MCY8934895.1 YggT family protein [Bacillus atrophaeus]MCY8943923.1 YggT family protein [Bacillus atrophaeus]MCY8945323.1 YggT family protein [Bacillus atrophaeus]